MVHFVSFEEHIDRGIGAFVRSSLGRMPDAISFYCRTHDITPNSLHVMTSGQTVADCMSPATMRRRAKLEALGIDLRLIEETINMEL